MFRGAAFTSVVFGLSRFGSTVGWTSMRVNRAVLQVESRPSSTHKSTKNIPFLRLLWRSRAAMSHKRCRTKSINHDTSLLPFLSFVDMLQFLWRSYIWRLCGQGTNDESMTTGPSPGLWGDLICLLCKLVEMSGRYTYTKREKAPHHMRDVASSSYKPTQFVGYEDRSNQQRRQVVYITER